MNKPQHQQGVQSYAADEDNPGTPIVRIRDPGPADVLCGRGGGINAHEGNAAFRELVKEQKRRYNLAAKKDEKAEISQTIVDHIKSKNGRFLQHDPTSKATIISRIESINCPMTCTCTLLQRTALIPLVEYSKCVGSKLDRPMEVL